MDNFQHACKWLANILIINYIYYCSEHLEKILFMTSQHLRISIPSAGSPVRDYKWHRTLTLYSKVSLSMFSSSCEKFSNTDTALIRWNAWKKPQYVVACDALRLHTRHYGAAQFFCRLGHRLFSHNCGEQSSSLPRAPAPTDEAGLSLLPAFCSLAMVCVFWGKTTNGEPSWLEQRSSLAPAASQGFLSFENLTKLGGRQERITPFKIYTEVY